MRRAAAHSRHSLTTFAFKDRGRGCRSQYHARGDGIVHITGSPEGSAAAISWIRTGFAGLPEVTNCAV